MQDDVHPAAVSMELERERMADMVEQKVRRLIIGVGNDGGGLFKDAELPCRDGHYCKKQER